MNDKLLHTPLRITDKPKFMDERAIVDADNNTVAIIDQYYSTEKAEIIVTACNSYYQSQETIKELVEALEHAEKTTDSAYLKTIYANALSKVKKQSS